MAGAKFKRTLDPGQKARVLVVDDSIVVRRLVSLALDHDPNLEVVGTAQNGRDALEKLAALSPDVITMDIEMPEMDGLEAVRLIRQRASDVRVVMLSTLTERGAAATLEALSLGADDYVTKQSAGRSIDESTANLRTELVPKIKQFFTFTDAISLSNLRISEPRTAPKPAPTAPRSAPTPSVTGTPVRSSTFVPRIVAIGISTGGPTALSKIIPTVPADFRLPILVVQHMPPLFTRSLCERLQERCQLLVREAIHGEYVRPGLILFAPGDYHMRVHLVPGESQPRISLDQGPAENSCRPAVDVLFESVANIYGGASVAAVLTGMGHDGLRGAKLLKNAGAAILAQDEETSTVWGMPRAIAEAKIANAVLPLSEIVPQILWHCQRAPYKTDFKSQETTCLK